MNLEEVLALVDARLPASVVKRFGAEHLTEHQQNHQVVWVPRDDDFTHPDGAGTAAIYYVKTLVEAHLQAPDTGQLRTLRNRVIRALRAELGPKSFTLKGGVYGEQDGSGLMSNGPTYVLAFEVWDAVEKQDPGNETTTMATIRHVQQTVGFLPPGGGAS